MKIIILCLTVNNITVVKEGTYDLDKNCEQ